LVFSKLTESDYVSIINIPYAYRSDNPLVESLLPIGVPRVCVVFKIEQNDRVNKYIKVSLAAPSVDRGTAAIFESQHRISSSIF
jgi:hypothetical protein